MLRRLINYFFRKIGFLFGAHLQRFPASAIIFSDPKSQIFFGYYDIFPLDNKEQYLLACRTPARTTSPHMNHPSLDVGFFDMRCEIHEFKKLASTETWNWQQGCRLQWTPDFKNILYNTFENGTYKSVIQNFDNGKIVQSFDWPIYSISPDGKKALTLNFSRLHRLRPGYGYSQLPDDTSDQIAPVQDGLWEIDLLKKNRNLLFSLKQLTQIEPLPCMEGAQHYINHLDFSPEGTKICFMHLWLTKKNRRKNRIIVYDLESKRISIPTNEGHASHHCWKSESEILIYSRLHQTGENYHLFNVKDGSLRTIGEGVLTEDGHPSFLNDHILLTDTYPNKIRLQKLYSYNLLTKQKNELGNFFSPKKFTKEIRCDLHPRASFNSDKICLDIVLKNRRAICLFNYEKG